MKPSTELFDLIKALTKSEKRFFKLHSSLQSGDKNYLKVFDAMDRQKVYDEGALKGQFANEVFIKHLPSEKNHLYKLILKALRAFHADGSVDGILKQEIKNIEILYRKALHGECNKLLQRAKRLAREHENFHSWLELLAWEKTLLEEAYESGEFTKDLDALAEEERQVLEKIRNLAAYHILYTKINYVFRSGGYVRTYEERAMVEEIGAHPLIEGRNTALSLKAATICYYTQGLCHWAKRDWKAALGKFERVARILDDAPRIRAGLPKRYVRTLQYIMDARIESGEFKEAAGNMARLRGLMEQPAFQARDTALRIYVAGNLAELRLLDRSGDHARAVRMIDELSDGMAHIGPGLHKEHRLELHFAFACAHFGAGSMNKALYWLNKVLNENEPALRQDIFTYARLFNLVLHYELGNHGLLEHMVRSTQRFLTKQHGIMRVESALAAHIRKLARAKGEPGRSERFRELQAELLECFKDPDERLLLKYFDVLSWVRAHVEGRSFSEVVREARHGP